MKSDSLLFGSKKFLKTDKKPFRNEKIQNLKFEFYELENPVTDGTG